MAKFEFDFSELEKYFNDIGNKLENLEGDVPFSDLFTPDFMRQYTSFDSIDSLFEAGGFHVETEEEFDALPEKDLDQHIAKNTKFNSWKEMLDKAGEIYLENRLDSIF